MRVSKLEEKQGKQFAPKPTEIEEEEHKKQILRSRIFSDTKFFQLVGIPPDKIKSWTHSLGTDQIRDVTDELD